MKIIQLTPKEFYLFKQIAKFFYEVRIIHSSVEIKADEKMLSMLGY